MNSLGGKYITAEDVGISTNEIEQVAMETKHVAGLPESMGGGGDPSPVTAYGVYMGIKASAKTKWGNDSLAGKTVLVQGAGHVGQYLVDHLVKESANVLIADLHEDKLKEITDKHKNVKIVSPSDVYLQDMDIYCPCALGATINNDTIDKLKCSIIAGAANNQLADENVHGKLLMEKGIFYAPDFLINAGGIINCYFEVIGYNREAAMKKTENIYNTTLNIYKKSKEENIPTYLAANRIAEQRIESIGNIKLSY